MDTSLRRRNTDDNLIFGDTVFLEPLYQFACLLNNRVLVCIPLDVDESEVQAVALFDKCSAVLSELFKMSSQFWGFNARRNG